MSPLTDWQLNVITIIERSCSAVSLLGCVFIITTFLCSVPFREKPVNRLVFYASFGNMATNIGTLMSRSFLDSPDSVGCQIQAMLIQWFMAADAGWILAMAINVYLTVYRKYDVKRLHKMELVYLLVCYGTPFIPAFTYIFVRHNGQRVYGDAVLWCWVVSDFESLRIATFYGPAWVMIFVTFSIYICTARTIFKIRKQVHELSSNYDISSFDSYEISTTNGNGLEATTTGAPRHDDYPTHASGNSPDSKTGNNVSASRAQGPSARHRRHVSTQQHSARRRSYEHKNAAWSYSKCALLYFTAILITWIPATANRVYSIVNNGDVIAPLAYMSAFVLPLQGFWNCLIYVVMSWDAYNEKEEDEPEHELLPVVEASTLEKSYSKEVNNIWFSEHRPELSPDDGFTSFQGGYLLGDDMHYCMAFNHRVPYVAQEAQLRKRQREHHSLHILSILGLI